MTDAQENNEQGEAEDHAGPGHNKPPKLEAMTPEQLRSNKIAAKRIFDDLVSLHARRGNINQEMSSLRGALEEMGFNKAAIKNVEKQALLKKAENTAPLDGYHVSMRILSAAIGMPIEPSGQMGMFWDEVEPDPEPIITESRAGETTHIPPSPKPPKKRTTPSPIEPEIDIATVFGPKLRDGVEHNKSDIALQVPLVPDTIPTPAGMIPLDFNEAFIKGRTAWRRGFVMAAPAEWSPDKCGVWDAGWRYEATLNGEGGGDAPVAAS
jgi:hypothetical protein